MRTLYVVSLAVTVAMFAVTGYFSELYASISWDIFVEELSGTDPYGYLYTEDPRYYELQDITFSGAIATMVFSLFYVFAFSFTLAKLKRKTAAIISTIGVSISGIISLACLVPLSVPANVAFDDEFAPLIFLYGITMLAFCIVNLVQAIRNTPKITGNSQILDDLE